MMASGVSTSLKLLTVAVTSVLATAVAQADVRAKMIGDLEIYNVPDEGAGTVTMMIDTSGSMGLRYLKLDETFKIGSTEYHRFHDTTQNDVLSGDCQYNDGGTLVKVPYSAPTVFKIPYILDDGTPKKNDDGTDYEISVSVYGCPLTKDGTLSYNNQDGTTVGYLSRLSKVKLALIGLLANEKILDNKNKFGMGNYSVDQDGDDKADARAGRIAVPAKELDTDHRLTLINYINSLTPLNGTPSAHAYAEAGAYMLGTTTFTEETHKDKGWVELTGSGNNQRYVYYTCTENATTATKHKLNQYVSILVQDCIKFDKEESKDTFPEGDATSNKLRTLKKTDLKILRFDADKLGKVDSKYWDKDNEQMHFIEQIDNGTSGQYSGFPQSDKSTKVGDEANAVNYQSPVDKDAKCGGQGVYFLTDGDPNSSDYRKATDLMNKSLSYTDKTKFIKTNVVTYKDGNAKNDTDCKVSVDPNAKFKFNIVPGPYEGAWGCMGEYAKKLKDPNKNPLGAPIKTAAAGFGSLFAPNGKVPTQPHYNPKLAARGKTLVKCEDMTDTSARNLCILTEKGYGYGEGGFVATNSPKELAESVKKFIEEIGGNIETVPSGTIVIPEDPYSAGDQQAVAYYPSIEPQVLSDNAIWPGNMKKYALNEGTLYGKNDIKLFLDFDGVTSSTPPKERLAKVGKLNPEAVDFWSDKDYTNNNNAVSSGGFYALLKSPAKLDNNGNIVEDISSQRTVYVEDWDAAATKNPVLRLFSVDASGKVNLDGKPLSATNNFVDTATYTDEKIKDLLSFLGFSGPFNDGSGNLASSIADIKLDSNNMQIPIRVLGASVHSKPALVSYYANLDSDGRIKNGAGSRDEYVLFGSMDGALHLVDADNEGTGNGGKEKFAFIPREIVKNQSEALKNNGLKGATGIVSMGMDAPWLVTADYKYDYTNKKVKLNEDGSGAKKKGMYAYGGMRMGGTSFYGLDLTNSNKTLDAANLGNTPKVLFNISPATTGFSRMGQIWSKPVRAKIRTSTGASDKGTDVIIFGGGYDTCYENETFQVGAAVSDTIQVDGKNKDVGKGNLFDSKGASCNKSEAQGNAIYMVNAVTGDLIWSASASGATTNVSDMKNSIVGGVTTLDRNGDGYMDHIYFADLGGQLFRADFQNAGFMGAGGFTNTRVVKVLESAFTGKYALRFYERPVVSFTTNANGQRAALINLISGDRSSPLSKMRDDNSKANRVYGILDYNITKANDKFYGAGFTQTALTDSNFYNLSTDIGTTTPYTQAQKQVVINGLDEGLKVGWYYPLIRFEGYNNVRFTKGVGKSEVLGGYLFTTTYNPDMNYDVAKDCHVSIVGGSERQLYCLPYGVCKDDSSNNGTAGFIRAGRGIQELTLGPRSEDNRNQRVLIGTKTLEEQTRPDVQIGFDNHSLKDNQAFRDANSGGDSQFDPTPEGGDGSGATLILEERYQLRPTTWYEKNR